MGNIFHIEEEIMRIALILSLIWFVLLITSNAFGVNTFNAILVTLGLPWGIYFIIATTRK